MSDVTAGDVSYRGAGSVYAARRRADPRIAAVVHAALGQARTVVNVGAGTGSYEPVDRTVVAVEPSADMRTRRRPGSAPVVDAVAERLPFGDAAFDAAMAMVTIHQWRDVVAGLRELRRVTGGPVVVLTFDGAALERFWLGGYVPELIAAERRRYPSLARIEELLGGQVRVTSVPIPIDCLDGFTEAYYGRPEALLDDDVRRAQSAWRFVPDAVARAGLERLRSDLETGEWDRRHGGWRRRPTYDGSLRLVVASPTAPEGSGG